MTHIVQGFKTKKALKEAVAHLCSGEAGIGNIRFDDPSVHAPRPVELYLIDGKLTIDGLPPNQSIYVTNHPKRSWFARVSRGREDKIVVS